MKTVQGHPGPTTFSKCWKCGGVKFRRYGNTPAGSIRFRCSDRRRCGVVRADNGHPPHWRKKQSATTEREQACRMYQDGATSHQIADALGRTPQGILNWIREAGVTVRRGGRARGIRLEQVRSYPTGCHRCGGEVLADSSFFICQDCGFSRAAA